MKSIFLILLCIASATLHTIGQQADSTYYEQFYGKAGVQDVIYEMGYFNNGELSYKGWSVHRDYPGWEYLMVYLGEWKYYRKNGNLKYVQDFGMNDSDTLSYKGYNRNGELVYESFFQRIEDLDPSTKKSLTSRDASHKDNAWEEFTIYSHGTVVQTGRFEHGKKAGTWQYFKDGALKKEKQYRAQ